MSEVTEKIYCYDHPSNYQKDNSALWAALMKDNNNAAEMSALMNNGGFGGNWNNPFMYLVWMWMMRWMNGNGWGTDAEGANYNSRAISQLQTTIDTNHNNDLAMQAINGNAAAIKELATQFNCSSNTMQLAICGVKSAIDTVGGQVGFTGERVINAINSGDCGIIQAVNNTSCATLKAILEMGYQNLLANCQQTNTITNRIEQLANGVQTGFATTAYETQSLTNALLNSLQHQTLTIIDKINALESNAQQDKINSLTALLTAANSRAERAAELAPIIQQLNAIKAAQPNTVAIQYPQLTAYPSYLNGAANNAVYGNTGFWN